MKPVCQKCPLQDKSKEACVKRLCVHADLPPPPPAVEPVSPWPLAVGSVIRDGQIEMVVTKLRQDNGDFVAQMIRLPDDDRAKHGDYGSYVVVGRYYKFVLNQDYRDSTVDPQLVWEIPEEGTDRFHCEGSTGAQFLLYWFKSTGFSFDLDS